jgi:thiol-disulfide isomerase/thioredoxin
MRGLLLCGVLLGLACSVERPAQPGEPAPDFDLALLAGGRATLASHAGQLLLVDFWATWCPPCIKEVPELNAVHAEFAGDGVAVLAVAIDPTEHDRLGSWSREHGAQYPIALGTLELAQEYGAFQFPYHLLIGPDGTIIERLMPGYHDRDELRELVQRHRP